MADATFRPRARARAIGPPPSLRSLVLCGLVLCGLVLCGLVLCGLAAGCAGSGSRGDVPAGALPIGSSSGSGQSSFIAANAVGGFLGVGYLFLDDDQSPSGIERTEHNLQERVGLGAEGSVYSPNFLKYEGTGVIGFPQTWGSDASGSSFDTGELYEAFASAHLFPLRIHPADVTFSRTQDFRPRVFLSQLETTTTIARGEQFLRLDDGDIRVFAERREIDQEQFGVELTPFLSVAENNFGVSGDYRLTAEQMVNAGYTYQDVHQNTEGQSYTRHNADGYHNLNLGGPSEFQLGSRVEYQDQDGALDQKLFRWTETMNLWLVDTLRGDGNFYFTRNDTNIVDLQELQADAGLTHQLYESLTTSVRMRGGRSDSDGVSTTDNLGGTFGFRYQKKNPVGVLRASYFNTLERRWVSNAGGGAIDEAHTFPTTQPEEVRLNQQGVDLGSLVVTDPSGLLFYQLGLDYTVTQDGTGVTTLSRVFTGNIPFGGEVFVDYTYALGTNYTLDTMYQAARIEHEFLGGWTPYVALNDQDQNVVGSEGNAGITPVRERSLIGGLEWRHPTWTVGGEYEDRESTIQPYEAVRLKAQFSERFAEIHHLTLFANQSWIDFREPERHTAISQGNAYWRTFLDTHFSVFGDGALQYNRDNIQGQSFGFSVGAGLEYRWRGFTIRLRGAYRETRAHTSDFQGEEVGVWIVREFGKLPVSTDEAKYRFLTQ